MRISRPMANVWCRAVYPDLPIGPEITPTTTPTSLAGIGRGASEATTKHGAIQLRKDSTPAERRLWLRIRNDQLGVTFRRQHAVGNYIPDFCSPKVKFIVELDGSQHLEQEESDEERTKYFESLDYKVIRFWNHDVMNNIDSVIFAIMNALEDRTSKD